MEDVLFELIRVLPKNGEWKFEGQKERWLHAASILVDLVLDKRKQIAQKQWFEEQVEIANTKDIGLCEVVILCLDAPTTPT